MTATIKLATTAKGIFSIVSAIVVAGAAVIGASVLTKDDAVTELITAIHEKARREHIKNFLYHFVGWKARPASLVTNSPLLSSNDLAIMLKDLPGFWRNVEAIDNSLSRFAQMNADELLSLEGCKPPTGQTPLDAIDPNHPVDPIARYHEIRNKIVEASWITQPLVRQARDHGLPQQQAANTPLDNIQFFASISDETIATANYIAKQIKSEPNNWVCRPINLKTILDLKERPARPRLEFDGNYRAFVSAIGSDAYGERIRQMTPIQFEAFYVSENARLEELIRSTDGNNSVKVLEWLPALPLASWMKWFPLLSLAGLAIILILLHRLGRAIYRQDMAIDTEDPGFPTNLVMPPANTGQSSVLDHLLAWIILALPCGIGGAIVYLQFHTANSISTGITPGETTDARDVLTNVAQAIAPTSLQIVCLGVAIVFTIVTIGKMESVVRQICKQT